MPTTEELSTTYRLLGVAADSSTCDCCHRTLKRVFRIAGPTGEGNYGSACAKKLTGWTPKIAQALYLQAVADREAEMRAAYPGLLEEIEALMAYEYEVSGPGRYSGVASEARWALIGSYATVKCYWYGYDYERALELLDVAAGRVRELGGDWTVNYAAPVPA